MSFYIFSFSIGGVKMLFKTISKVWLVIVTISLSMMFLISVIVDPIDILGMPIIKGVNNYKVKQGSYLDVYKPYQVLRYKPEVVFIGTSRVYNSLKPQLQGYSDDKVYNQGFSALSLNDMEKYLDFIYKVNKPKKIFIGLDLFQFGKDNFSNTKENFSQERLNKVVGSAGWRVTIEALKENFQVSNLLLDTIKESFKYNDRRGTFDRGWRTVKGSNSHLNTNEYYETLNSYSRRYGTWEYEEKAVYTFKRIIDTARENNVDVYVFFNPISVDMLVFIDVWGLHDDLRKIKQKVVNVCDIVYDFNYINESTTDRIDLFYDASHCNVNFGEIIKRDILKGVDTKSMMCLTCETVDEKLEYQSCLNKKWFLNNGEYIRYLQTKIKNNERFKKNELENFIGF